jgi:osmotically-inducible protein OsmY
MTTPLDFVPLLSNHCVNNAERIRRDVIEEFANTNRTQLRRLRCDYRHGVLYLLGQVDTYFLKQLALEHARRVDGVTHVVNSVRVTGHELETA